MNSRTASLVILGVVSLVFLAGCGGSAAHTADNQSVTAPTRVTVLPSSATVQGGGVQQFAATVSPSGGNQAVTWSVAGTGCTGASCGTIDSTGKYTAPATVPNPPTVVVRAISVEDATKAATATVTISAVGDNPSPRSVAVAADPSGKVGKFAYVANFGSNKVSMYAIDAATGALTPTGTVAAGTNPSSVAVNPSGKFAYVTDYGSDNVSMYSIDATTGALTSTGTVAAGANPSFVATDLSGKFAYVANFGSNKVSMYTIDATTGTLMPTGTVATGAFASSVAVHPSGKFAYVTDLGEGHMDGSISDQGVSMYTVDVSTDVLTSIGFIDAGITSATSMAIDPSGKLAYVVNEVSNNIAMFIIDTATGALTLIGTIGT